WQASRLHFLRKLVLAAPARGLPSLLTALLSQLSWASAGAGARLSDSSKVASKIPFIRLSLRWTFVNDHESREAGACVRFEVAGRVERPLGIRCSNVPRVVAASSIRTC